MYIKAKSQGISEMLPEINAMKKKKRKKPSSLLYDVFIIYLLIIIIFIIKQKKGPQVPCWGSSFIWYAKKKEKKKERKKERGRGKKKSSPSITRDEQLVLIFICINFHIF